MINLTREEFDIVIALLKDDLAKRVFFKLAYYHGMRRGELLNLTGADIVSNTIRIRRLKQRKKPLINIQPLNPDETVDVQKYTSSTVERLFPWSPAKASNMVRQVLTDAGIYTVPYQKSLHSLRHSCGRAIYRACHDIVQVAEYLGHKSVESSRIYSHPDAAEVFETARKAL